MELSKMFGVKRYTPFMVKDLVSVYIIGTDNEGIEQIERVDEGASESEVVYGPAAWRVINAAPSGIIHLPPPLKDEQREQLKALYTLTFRWIVKNKKGAVIAYSHKPYRYGEYWATEKVDANIQSVAKELSVCSLVSWSDTEPFDIAKALGIKN